MDDKIYGPLCKVKTDDPVLASTSDCSSCDGYDDDCHIRKHQLQTDKGDNGPPQWVTLLEILDKYGVSMEEKKLFIRERDRISGLVHSNVKKAEKTCRTCHKERYCKSYGVTTPNRSGCDSWEE